MKKQRVDSATGETSGHVGPISYGCIYGTEGDHHIARRRRSLIRNLIRLMLSKEGYAVLTANDGQEALEICRSFKDPIHLLLTDKTMPRMNGLELAENVLKKRSEIKIMIMSGETAETILNENTPGAFLSKPFMPPTLLTCVRRLLTSQDFSGICQESDLL